MVERNEEKIKLKFEPITEGLGFHPFSDGLPYAPTSTAPTAKRPPSEMGTGAVAAGPATFVTNSSPRRVSVPVATPKPVLEPRMPAAPLMPAQPGRSTIVARTGMSAHAAPKAQLETRFESSYGFVYLLKRVLAYALDTVLNITLCATALSMALVNQNIAPEELLSPGVVLMATLFVTIFSWALVTAQEVAFGTSVGKRVFGLAIEGGASAAFLRAFFFLPSAGFAGLGLLWAVFDRKRRCWHDLVVDSQPIEIARI